MVFTSPPADRKALKERRYKPVFGRDVTVIKHFMLNTTKTICLVITGAMIGCAGVPARTTTAENEVVPKNEIMRDSGVRVVQLETPSSVGQTTWKIESSKPLLPGYAAADKGCPPHIEQRLRNAFDLGQRGATYSAQTEFQAVLGLCALDQDVRTGTHDHQVALRQALTALIEANDFAPRRTDIEQQLDVPAIAAAHSTRQFFPQRTHEADATVAVQAYFAFAEERLRFACGNMPAASAALYGMGRVEPLLADGESLATARAVLFHRAALAVDHNNALAANELGVLLARHGLLGQAEQVFQNALASGESTDSVKQNLAAVNRMLGKSVPPELQPAATSSLAGSQRVEMKGQQAASNAATLVDMNTYTGGGPTNQVTQSGHVSPVATESPETPTSRTAWNRLPNFTGIFKR